MRAAFKVAVIAAALSVSACGAPADVDDLEESAVTRAPSLTPSFTEAFNDVIGPRLDQMTRCPDVGTSAPAVPHAFAPGVLSEPLVSFEGNAETDACGSLGWPSDDSGVIGRHHFVQTTNFGIAVYDRAGRRLAGPVSTGEFFSALPDCDIGTDITVSYDRHADRWIVQAVISPRVQCIAISRGSDPMGQYHIYAFHLTAVSRCHDFPKLAVWPDGYYVTDSENGFEGFLCPDFGQGPVGNLATAFDRHAMLRGDHRPRAITFLIPAPEQPAGTAGTHTLPADADGFIPPPPGRPELLVQLQDDEHGFAEDRLQVWEFHADFRHPMRSTLRPVSSLPTEPFSTPAISALPQPGVPSELFTPSPKILNFRLAYRNFGNHEAMVVNHSSAAGPSGSLAGLRWYELRHRRAGAWTIFQQATYAPDENHRNLGSIAMDRRGNIAMGYEVMSADVFPSIRYAARLPTDPLGTLPRGENSLVAGNGSLTGSGALGDYAELTVDPLDDCTFWLTNTYVPAPTTTNGWHTRIGAFRLRTCRP